MFEKLRQAAADSGQSESGIPSGFREEFKRREEAVSKWGPRSRHVTVPGVEALVSSSH
jgi:hypothetical protein